MTEAEWLTCADPQPMLVFLERRASQRKVRLFACGLGRSLWPYLGDDRSRRVVEVAEQYADGLATQAELAAAEEAALGANSGPASRLASWVGDQGPWQAARMIVLAIWQAQREHIAKDWSGKMGSRSRAMLHCVFSNPFRPVTLDPKWLLWNHGTVPAIARRVYDERAFHDLPILADALEDAGCTDQDILAHCRTGGPHVRGCWVVDLVLGKE
jgi:hypothetical protein